MNHNHISYDDYDYSEFWKGRDYEDRSDKIAIARLFRAIPVTRNKLIDIGAGRGRLVPLYEAAWREFVLLDSSQRQIDEARNNIADPKKATLFVGTAEAIQFPDATFDTALCTRVFHYLPDPTKVVREMARILKPDGYLVLEIPNKLHFKNRLKALFGNDRNAAFSPDPISRAKEFDTVFVNHNPKTIQKLLEFNNFQVIEILSVSNFRSAFLKKILPVSFLVMLEKFLQKPLASFWFGPSIYFLARKMVK